jgi:hypothetical protein
VKNARGEVLAGAFGRAAIGGGILKSAATIFEIE